MMYREWLFFDNQIGINYHGQSNELLGCVNDAKNVRRFLNRMWSSTLMSTDSDLLMSFPERYGYHERNIRMLTDDASDPRSFPTRKNIIRAMEWLVRDAQPNDSLFLHCTPLSPSLWAKCWKSNLYSVDSGHGAQVPDKDGDEVDGYDEGLCLGLYRPWR